MSDKLPITVKYGGSEQSIDDLQEYQGVELSQSMWRKLSFNKKKEDVHSTTGLDHH